MNRRRAVEVLGALFAAPACAHQPPRSAAELMDVLMWGREPIGGPFTLVDHTGRRRSDRDFRGKLMLVYFGFINCPDVCPTDLREIALAMNKLGTASEQLQPLFITLDPQRDTPRHLATYVAAFHPRVLGLTGTPEAIRQVANAYRVFFRRVSIPGGGYTIEHASFTFLTDRAGKYVGFFPPGTTADRMVEIIRPQLQPRRVSERSSRPSAAVRRPQRATA
jgi:cytochrome oxidase Cu insertion factor (SCO1/SenC/PrrC family)